jgi:hypothetical protein
MAFFIGDIPEQPYFFITLRYFAIVPSLIGTKLINVLK